MPYHVIRHMHILFQVLFCHIEQNLNNNLIAFSIFSKSGHIVFSTIVLFY